MNYPAELKYSKGHDWVKMEGDAAAPDVAKSLIDYGMHPPTMYFPLIVHEALMLEPDVSDDRAVI